MNYILHCNYQNLPFFPEITKWGEKLQKLWKIACFAENFLKKKSAKSKVENKPTLHEIVATKISGLSSGLPDTCKLYFTMLLQKYAIFVQSYKSGKILK